MPAMPALVPDFGLPTLFLSPSAPSPSAPSPSPTTIASLTVTGPGPFAARQNTIPTSTLVVIPATYGSLDDSPAPGVVVAIVLGSVAGFLVLLFIVYSALGFGPAAVGARVGARAVSSMASRSVLSFRSRPEPAKHHRNSRRGGAHATEMFEVRTRERVVQDGQQAPPIIVDPTRQPPPPRPPPRVVRDDDEDEVVVIEEHSTPPPRKSRRHSSRSRRSDERRRTYRDLDPGRFAAGDAPPREAGRDGGRRYSGRDYSGER